MGSIAVDFLVMVLVGAALCCHALLMAQCELLTLLGETTDGSYGLFFVTLPDSSSATCTETRLIDEVNGRYGAGGLVWKPREDDYLRGAQIGATFGFALGFILLVFIFFRQFLCPLPCTDFLMDVCCLGIQVGLAMVYLLWMSDGCYYFECGLGQAGGILIAAQVLWIIASCMTKCMRPSAFARKKAIEDAKKKEEEEKKKKEKAAKKKDLEAAKKVEDEEPDEEVIEEVHEEVVEEEVHEEVVEEEVEEIVEEN